MSPTSVLDATLIFDSDTVSTSTLEASSVQTKLVEVPLEDPDCSAVDLDADNLDDGRHRLAASLGTDDYTDCFSAEEDAMELGF